MTDFDTDSATLGPENGGVTLAGRYRILRQPGQGGMGSVYLAEDMQLDGKLFAIKMLPSVLVSNKRAYRQLKREALVAMELVHPNIVQLRAFEENNGNPFLVMDYIDGQTLDDLLAEKETLAIEEAVALLKPIAAALDYAHSQNVVHRDVKPANVIVRKDGVPFVLDFGIACEIRETMTRVTGKSSGGTLLYMSPEQLNGASPKPLQDVYSFAAMAYECLKGEPPFTRGDVEFQIMHKIPEPLAGYVVANGQLVAGIMSGLAKKSEDRPESCVAVLGMNPKFQNYSLRTSKEQTADEGLPASGVESATMLVLCPVCGKKNAPKDTFRCRECGRDNICLRHQDEATFLCAECTIAQRKALEDADSRAKSERRAREAAEREVALRNGTCRETGICRKITLPGGATMEMIYVAPGRFTMGSPESEEGRVGDETQRDVTLTQGFWLGKYEVTQEQWESAMGYNPSCHKGDNLPVEEVSWNECQEFCQKVSEAAKRQFGGEARLLTEAEWEYACRAGSTGAYGGTGNLDSMGYSGSKTHPVGRKQSNAWGFYDMHGNVWEWCNDCYDAYSGGSETDPTGPVSGDDHALRGRVLRGGGWDDFARYCRSADRDGNDPGCRGGDFGFRLACSAGPRGQGAEQ